MYKSKIKYEKIFMLSMVVMDIINNNACKSDDYQC